MNKEMNTRVYDALIEHGLDLPLTEFMDNLQEEMRSISDIAFAAYAVQVLSDMAGWASFDEADREMVREFGTLYVEFQVLVSDLLRRNPDALL